MKTARTFHLAVHLTLAAAYAAGPILACAFLEACSDENDPQTWVKKLDDPAQRAGAIKRLSQFFDDAMTRANKNREDPQVKALLDTIVEPMTKVYTGGNLDDKTRKDLIKFLADTRDPRTGPALAKAFNEYEPGKNGEDVKFAAQAIKGMAESGKLSDQNLTDALWNCFAKFQPSKERQSSNLVRDLHDAVVAVKSPSYGPKAVDKLSAPVDPKIPDQGLDQIQFWQLTAIQIIGDIKFVAAIKPLVTLLLTPTKSDLRATATNALMRMPKEAEPVLISALKGTDPDFAKLTPLWENKSYVPVLADTLSWLSRPAGRDAVLDALANADNDENRTILAQSLVHFPPEARLVRAFLDAYKKIPSTATSTLLRGANAHGALTQAAAQFYDPTLTDWLVHEIVTAKGEAADEMQLFALDSAIKLMTPSQMGSVNGAVNGEGTPREKDMYKLASGVVQKCGQDAGCYVKVLEDPIPSSPPTAAEAAVKAAWMAVIYGQGKTDIRAQLVDHVDRVKNGGARLALAEAIDALAPQGDAAAADKLEKVVESDKASGNVSQADDAVIKVALRLRARAQ
jgi:hypothetical protein